MSPTPRKEELPRRGLALEGSTVAFGPARSLTSHARRIYHERYRGRYRFAGLVFAFDAFLVGVAVTLCIATIAFLAISPARFDGGLRVEARAPAMRGSDAVPLAVTVRATDGRRHDGVRLRLQVPDWAEIMRSEPPMARDGSVDLGHIGPLDQGKVLFVIRSRAVDVDLPLVFRVQQEDWTGLRREIDGRETRHVGGSVLSAAPDASVTSTAAGAVIPFEVRNAAATAIPSVIFRLASVRGGEANIGGSDAFAVGELGPGESRRVFVDISRVVSSTLSLSWQVQDGAQAVVTGTTTLPVMSGSVNAPTGRFSSDSFPLQGQVRYFTTAGDQVGVGPVPPVVGQTTTYWAAFVLGPTDGPLKDIVIRARLPEEVRATGKYAAPIDASFTAKGHDIEWHLASAPAIGADHVTLAFEIAFTPVKGQAGSAAIVLPPARAEAYTEEGKRLTASSTVVMTESPVRP